MGICYSQEEEWENYNKNYQKKRRNRKKKNFNSIIYEQKSFCESSFASKVQNSFRQDLHNTLSNMSSEIGSIAIGSVNQMSQKQYKALQTSIQLINDKGQDFNYEEALTLCNLKTKNFLHTHKIKLPQNSKVNEVSSCPYTSNHILQYDLWKFIPLETNNQIAIYHPFTQKFLGVSSAGDVCCDDNKYSWTIKDYGRRRNGGFIKLIAFQNGEKIGDLCMTDQQSLLANHRKLTLCTSSHIGHLWEINFGECLLE